MNNYLSYLQSIQNPYSFKRKIQYIKYNFSHFVDMNNKNLSVLEIGPGLGEFVSFLNDNGLSNIDIFDNDKNVTGYIEKKYKIKHAIFGEDLTKDIPNLKTYDIIFLLQVLEHIPKHKYVSTLKTLYKSLNPKGKIIITVPNGGNPLNLSERYSDITHETLFTENSLQQLCLSSNLKISRLNIYPYRIPPTSILNIIRIGLQTILHLFIKLSLIINGGVYSKILTPNIVMTITK